MQDSIRILSERQWFVKIDPDEIINLRPEVGGSPITWRQKCPRLDRDDGLGLVHIEAEDLCDADPRLVLPGLRRAPLDAEEEWLPLDEPDEAPETLPRLRLRGVQS